MSRDTTPDPPPGPSSQPPAFEPSLTTGATTLQQPPAELETSIPGAREPHTITSEEDHEGRDQNTSDLGDAGAEESRPSGLLELDAGGTAAPFRALQSLANGESKETRARYPEGTLTTHTPAEPQLTTADIPELERQADTWQQPSTDSTAGIRPEEPPRLDSPETIRYGIAPGPVIAPPTNETISSDAEPFGDEGHEDTQTVGPQPCESQTSDSLKFERLVRHLIGGNYYHFISWGFAEVLLCLGVFKYVDHQSFGFTAKQYIVILVTGSLAVNGNLFFILFISERIRRLRPFVQDITGDDSAISKLFNLVYQDMILYGAAVICIALGLFTFAELGISAPPPITKGIKMGLVAVFGTLGLVIGFVINVWRFFIALGSSIRKIDTCHPDRMGGLKPIADVNSRLLFVGALLIVVYSFGAGHSPYEYLALKAFAYLWSVLAMFLWVIAAFLPTITIHRVLRDTKLRQQNELAALKKILLTSFERTITGNAAIDVEILKSYTSTIWSAVDVVKYFEQDLEMMVTWLYRDGYKSVARLFSIPTLVTLLVNWNQISKVFARLANIHPAG